MRARVVRSGCFGSREGAETHRSRGSRPEPLSSPGLRRCSRGGTTRRTRRDPRPPDPGAGEHEDLLRRAIMALSQSRIITVASGPTRTLLAYRPAWTEHPATPVGIHPPEESVGRRRQALDPAPVLDQHPADRLPSFAPPAVVERLVRHTAPQGRGDRCAIEQTDNLFHGFEHARQLRRLEPVVARPERPHDDRGAVHPSDRLVVQREHRHQDLAAFQGRDSRTHRGAGFWCAVLPHLGEPPACSPTARKVIAAESAPLRERSSRRTSSPYASRR